MSDEITFELYDKDKDSHMTRYIYIIVVNGEPTCLLYTGDSEWKSVRGSITIDVDVNNNVLYSSEFYGEYELNTDGTIVHGKKQVINEWEQIKKWALERLNIIVKSCDNTIDLLETSKKYCKNEVLNRPLFTCKRGYCVCKGRLCSGFEEVN